MQPQCLRCRQAGVCLFVSFEPMCGEWSRVSMWVHATGQRHILVSGGELGESCRPPTAQQTRPWGVPSAQDGPGSTMHACGQKGVIQLSGSHEPQSPSVRHKQKFVPRLPFRAVKETNRPGGSPMQSEQGPLREKSRRRQDELFFRVFSKKSGRQQGGDARKLPTE